MALTVDIRKRCRSFSLDVRFAAENETLGVLGASGCGKSMTLKCIAGIEKPDEGRIALDDRVLFDSDKGVDLPPQRRGVGYLFQQYALFPHMTAAENIAAGMKGAAARREIAEYIRQFHLDGLEGHYPRQLSGGQQQRVALARMLASKPEILMLDEPFSALDNYLKWQLELELMEILSQYAKTALFVSHDRDEIYRFCDKIAVLSDGRLECVKTKKEMFERPETLTESKLSGCKNHSRIARLDRRRVYASEWELELDCARDVAENLQYVGIRAHDLTIADDVAQSNTFLFSVERVVEELFSVVVTARHGRAPRPLRVEMDKKTWRGRTQSDRPLYLRLPPDKLLMLRGNAR